MTEYKVRYAISYLKRKYGYMSDEDIQFEKEHIMFCIGNLKSQINELDAEINRRKELNVK